MKNLSLIFLAILFVGCQTNKSAINDPSLTTYFEASSIPSAIMGKIDSNGNVDWHRFGPSVWEDSTKIVSENDIFRYYSMTKAITSVAALQLVEKGLIKLDDPLNELMPEMVKIPILTEEGNLVESNRPVTLRQLMSNTSGFGLVFFSPRLYNFDTKNWDHIDYPRLFQPGTAYAYGTGLDWVGKVIEKISGQDLETYFRQNITGPLKMDDTWFNVPTDLTEKIVTLGGRDSSGIIKIHRWNSIRKDPVTDFKGSSGLFGSPDDYLKFLHCMLNYGEYDGGRLLKKETVQLMFRDHVPKVINMPAGEKFDNGGIMGYSEEQSESMKNDRWGMGWYLEMDESDVRPVNSGYWGGAANTYFTVDPKNGIAIVYFSNYFPANDKESYDLYKLYENQVYAALNNDK